jgi:peptidoglycan/xylan/chitin deacetylase (PgdA/CDA1 family)
MDLPYKRKNATFKYILLISGIAALMLGLLAIWLLINKENSGRSLDNYDNTMAAVPPVLTLKGGADITVIEGNEYEEPGYDADGIELSDQVIIEGNVDINRAGTYEIKYSVTNSAGHTASASRVVTVITRVPHAQVPIFMYHEIADETWGLEGLFVKINDFEAQMKYLSDNGYQTLFMNEIKNQSDFHKKVILTFDDAYIGFYTNALPILKKYNIKANLYVITSSFDDVFVSVEQLKEINDSGLVQIGSHTRSHPDLTALSQAALEAELKESKEMLEELLKTKITTFVYPLGKYNSSVADTAKRYYDDCLVIEGTAAKVNSDTNYHTLPRYGVYRNTTLQSFIDRCSIGM